MFRTKYYAFAVSVVLSLATLAPSSANAQEKLRISLDTNPSHVRNKGAEIFAAELKKLVGDKLTVEIYPSAQLFRDRDIPKALRQGAIEMGIPGTWQLDGIEPNSAIQTLPMFYGVSPEVVHKIIDGKLGDFLNKRMEERLKIKIIGKWSDLGMQQFYSATKPITSYEDLKGMKMRYSGGSANAARFEVLGIVPMLIPYPDLPMAMSQGVVNGIGTTHESAASAKLWDSGLKYSFEDKQFMGQYVPMLNLNFWNKQTKETQNAIIKAWDIAVTKERTMAKQAQIDARQALIDHGVKMAAPTEADLVEARKRLMTIQDDLVKKMNIDKEAVEIALEGLRAEQVKF